jgi:hypothetical protein
MNKFMFIRKLFFLVFLFFILFNSCTIDKRLYNRGYSIQWKNKNSILPSDSSELSIEKIKTTELNQIHSVKQKTLKNNFASENYYNKKYSSLDKVVDIKELKTIYKSRIDKKFIKKSIVPKRIIKTKNQLLKHSKIEMDDVLSFLGWFLGLIIVIGLIIGLGLLIQLMMPKVSLIITSIIGILFCITLFFILGLIFGFH